MSYIIELSAEQVKNISQYENLLFNMSAGVLPEHLTQSEVDLLKQKHGDNWFEELGYYEPEFDKSKFK